MSVGSLDIITNGLVFYVDGANDKSYPGTGTSWNDLTSGASNGVLTNGPTFNSSNGGSIVFDGINDYVSFTSNNKLAITGDMTICAWIYVNSLSGYNGIVGKTNGGFPNPYDLYTNPSSGALTFLRGNGSIYDLSVSTNGVTINKWQFVAVTMASSTVTHYLDGRSNGSSTLSTSISDGGTPMYIGSRNDGGTMMNGKISNVIIYNRALTPSEVLKNYNKLKWRFL